MNSMTRRGFHTEAVRDVRTDDPALSLRAVSKSYSGVVALTGVDLDVSAGEAVGLLGQNGAGKSTLVKIISGAEQPSAGSLYISCSRTNSCRSSDSAEKTVRQAPDH